MQGPNMMPRWMVENDPSWEKSIDSNLGNLKWRKKGTAIQAVCSPTSMFCEIVGLENNNLASGLADVADRIASTNQGTVSDDITKYLSSRYLNPGVNGPARFDISKDNLRKLRRY